jgi:hypothetical protein
VTRSARRRTKIAKITKITKSRYFLIFVIIVRNVVFVVGTGHFGTTRPSR